MNKTSFLSEAFASQSTIGKVLRFGMERTEFYQAAKRRRRNVHDLIERMEQADMLFFPFGSAVFYPDLIMETGGEVCLVGPAGVDERSLRGLHKDLSVYARDVHALTMEMGDNQCRLYFCNDTFRDSMALMSLLIDGWNQGKRPPIKLIDRCFGELTDDWDVPF